ncbi:MAG: hypothetical protein ACE14M_01640 [Terriglobales bacterium]
MNCAEFQRALPYIIESGGNAEQEAHLESCPICGDLVADLRYIAEAAKLLVPMEDPSPRVWEEIQKSLEREGLAARPTGPRGRLLEIARWGTKQSFGIVIVLALILAGIALSRRAEVSAGQNGILRRAVLNTSTASDDAQILAAVAENAPSLRTTYEDNLKTVNAYISDAKRQVEQNPNDLEAHQHLMRAYEQKNMLHQMALSRTLR